MAMNAFGKAAEKESLHRTHEVMKRILRKAKKNAPVDTGALVRSGRVRKLKSGSKVTFGGASSPRYVDYAHLVEYGSMNQPARYFLRRAFKSEAKNLPKEIRDGISKRWVVYAKMGSSR